MVSCKRANEFGQTSRTRAFERANSVTKISTRRFKRANSVTETSQTGGFERANLVKHLKLADLNEQIRSDISTGRSERANSVRHPN